MGGVMGGGRNGSGRYGNKPFESMIKKLFSSYMIFWYIEN